MKRIHIHLNVDDLASHIAFYSRLLDSPPARVEDDFAKWVIQDPPVNLSISLRPGEAGVDHLGIETDSAAELDSLKQRIPAADDAPDGPFSAGKHWVRDPQRIAWECFLSRR